MRKTISTFVLLLLLVTPVASQELEITFRYVPFGTVENAFVPGSFNGWGGPYNDSGCITPGHAAQMEYVRFENYWRKTIPLQIGERYEYKIQVHSTVSATECQWLSDPLNPEVNPGNNNNSVLVVADPMVFQPAEELTGSGLVRYFSAGLFSTEAITEITYAVNGASKTDGLDHYDAETGVFRYQLERDVLAGAQLRIDAVDAAGRTLTAEIGELQPPVGWLWDSYSTVDPTGTIPLSVTRLDGSVDPAVTGVLVNREGGGSTYVPISMGFGEFVATLELGENVFRIDAEVEGQSFESDPLTLTRKLPPLERFTVIVAVSGSGQAFQIDLSATDLLPSDYSVAWQLDERLSTVEAVSWTGAGLSATGEAAGAGELYFDVDIYSGATIVDQLRIAVVVEDDGSARAMDYAENAEWVKAAVVYEIFPIQFGPLASTGSLSNPGNRLNEIADELDYIAEMGFNTIWFMPIMRNRDGMTPLGAGYNIIDFYEIDERLGSKDDFRALVDRAHELGIRIVLDLTPNHVSPNHRWTNSLRKGGPYSDYLQTTPSPHNRGEDDRGANLAEIWQIENGENLYRKYEGFADLANLNWDDDDLQAEMLEIIAYWFDEFDIDGYRMDVWWGPIRRYGAARFAQPVRELVKRQRPDAWLLGEIAGTGSGTEVYYADDDNGTSLKGGLDSAYDWTFYWESVRGTYGNVARYHNHLTNYGFNPGPNSRVFRFLENHDEERIAKLYASHPDRIKPLAGSLITSPGIPMIYAGQEVNYGDGSGDTRRTSVNWSTPRNGEFAELYQRLAHARSQFPAFWTQQLESLYVARSTQDAAYAFVRPYLDENAVVAVNYENYSVTLTIDPSNAVLMSTDGPIPYYDLAQDSSAAYLGEFTITLPPYETVIYITSDAPGFDLPPVPPLPYGAVNTATDNQAGELPDRVKLHAAYPNPFNPVTQIGFDLPDSMPVRLEVFDVLGRRVDAPIDGWMSAGSHTWRFDASGLPSGTYLYRLQAGDTARSKTMVLVK